MEQRKKFEDNQPGMDQKRDIPNKDYQETRRAAESGEQGRTSYAPGSTTQGGSNYGQGSHYLAGDRYHQGDEGNTGANYQNEAGRFSEEHPAGTASPDSRQGQEGSGNTEKGQLSETRDDIPHGHGAHVNEKESNAQEDYPGTEESRHTDEPEKDII